MHEPGPSLWLATPQLSDEAAAQLLDFLHELPTGFENAYGHQLRRYYAARDPSAKNLRSHEPQNYDNDPF